MKKILILIVLSLGYLLGYSQFPITQSIGSPKTKVVNKGIFYSDSAIIVTGYTDTTQANLGYIKNIPHVIIATSNDIWIRNIAATAWLQLVNIGSGATDTLAWRLSGNNATGMGGTPVMGTISYTDFNFATNNLKRFGVSKDGIQDSTVNVLPLGIDTTTGYLSYARAGGGGGGGNNLGNSDLTQTDEERFYYGDGKILYFQNLKSFNISTDSFPQFYFNTESGSEIARFHFDNSGNTGIGYQVFQDINVDSAEANNANGRSALRAFIAGQGNTANGSSALSNFLRGSNNLAGGIGSMDVLENGSRNVGLGPYIFGSINSLEFNNNTGVGYRTGFNETRSNMTYYGTIPNLAADTDPTPLQDTTETPIYINGNIGYGRWNQSLHVKDTLQIGKKRISPDTDSAYTIDPITGKVSYAKINIIPAVPGTVYVTDYGADSTGVYGSALAFQLAVATGKTVIVPPTSRFYKINDTSIVINAGQTITGFGKRSLIKTTTIGGGSPFNIFQAGDTCVIDGLAFKGSGYAAYNPGPTFTYQNGIYLPGNYATVQNCYFDSISGSGIQAYHPALSLVRGNKVLNCTFTNNSVGILDYALSEYMTVDNMITHSNDYGIRRYAGNFVLSNSHIDYNVSAGYFINGSSNGDHGTNTNNSFNHNAGYAIRLSNIVIGELFTSCNFFFGIMDVSECDNLVFSNCAIWTPTVAVAATTTTKTTSFIGGFQDATVTFSPSGTGKIIRAGLGKANTNHYIFNTDTIVVNNLFQSVLGSNKMVVWDSVGKKLASQTIPSGANIYNSDGTLPPSTTRQIDGNNSGIDWLSFDNFNIASTDFLASATTSGRTGSVNQLADSLVISYSEANKLRYNFGKDTILIKGNITISTASTDSVLVRSGNVVKLIAQSDLGGGLLSGTYTPTLTNVANVSASTAYSCQWSRSGSVITVSGEVDIDPTTTLTLTQLGISLPVASNLTATNELGGTSADDLGTAARVAGDLSNNRAEVRMTPVDVTNRRFSFIFTYRIL